MNGSGKNTANTLTPPSKSAAEAASAPQRLPRVALPAAVPVVLPAPRPGSARRQLELGALCLEPDIGGARMALHALFARNMCRHTGQIG